MKKVFIITFFLLNVCFVQGYEIKTNSLSTNKTISINVKSSNNKDFLINLENSDYKITILELYNNKLGVTLGGKVSADWDNFGNELKVVVFTVLGVDF